jgi:hypothetical protein
MWSAILRVLHTVIQPRTRCRRQPKTLATSEPREAQAGAIFAQ